MVLPDRRSEYLDLRAPASPLLDGLARRLTLLAPGIVVQPSGPGGWTAYYLGNQLVAIARPAAGGPAGAIEVALPRIAWAAVVFSAVELEADDVDAMLRRAVTAPPSDASTSLGDLTQPTGIGPLDTLLGIVWLIGAAFAWLTREARERAVAAATDGERQRSILNAARREANLRENSLAIGCLGAIGVGLALTFAVIVAGAWLYSIGVPTGVVSALWLLLMLVPWLIFRKIRRRYPSPPQGPFDRFIGRLLQVAGVLIVAAFVVWIALAAR